MVVKGVLCKNFNGIVGKTGLELYLYFTKSWNFTLLLKTLFIGLSQEGRQLQSVEILRRLLFTAARIGEEKFIRLVFGTSAGRAAFEVYKNKSPLPENIADENGHKKIAAYLRSITERYLNSKRFQCAIIKMKQQQKKVCLDAASSFVYIYFYGSVNST